jgi:metal-responsive CopG/Arc/MetJ family transcriptional regulator
MKDALVVKLNEIITRYGFDSRSYEIIRVLIEKVDNLSFKSEVESSNESEKDSEIDSKTNSE